MKTIKSQWEFFENMVLTGVSDKQREEAYVAFHAGVLSILRMQLEIRENELTLEEAAKMFEGWIEEMDAFANERIAKIAARNPDFKPH